MFSFQQTKLFIFLGILLLVCFLGIYAASAQLRKSKNQPPPPAPINPLITPIIPTPTPAPFRFIR